MVLEGEDGIWTVIGLSSFVMLPCGQALPDYYTKVSHYLSWIHDNIECEEPATCQIQ